LEITKRILFLSFDFHPENRAGAIKNKHLSEALGEEKNLIIDVITASRDDPKKSEVKNNSRKNINLIRISELKFLKNCRKSSLFIKFYYLFFVLVVGKKHNYDLVYASTSKLGTAFIASLFSRIYKVQFYLDVRDLFSINIKSIYTAPIYFIPNKIITTVEKFSFKRAGKINIVSHGYKEYFNNNFPQTPVSFFPNGIDEMFLKWNVHFNKLEKRDQPNKKKLVMYAGNIGYGQRLDLIIPDLAEKTSSQLNYIIIGSGNLKNLLHKRLQERKVYNVKLINPVPREKLISYYKKADVLFAHLGNYKSFEFVLPSKIFEYAATGKPIWAGFSGYPAKFLSDQVQNVAIFKPCDVSSAISNLNEIEFGMVDRTDFLNRFERSKIIRAQKLDIKNMIEKTLP